MTLNTLTSPPLTPGAHTIQSTSQNRTMLHVRPPSAGQQSRSILLYRLLVWKSSQIYSTSHILTITKLHPALVPNHLRRKTLRTLRRTMSRTLSSTLPPSIYRIKRRSLHTSTPQTNSSSSSATKASISGRASPICSTQHLQRTRYPKVAP